MVYYFHKTPQNDVLSIKNRVHPVIETFNVENGHRRTTSQASRFSTSKVKEETKTASCRHVTEKPFAVKLQSSQSLNH